MSTPAPLGSSGAAALAGRVANALRLHPRLSNWELGRLLGVPVEQIEAVREDQALDLRTLGAVPAGLTDAALLSIYLSGVASGAGTALAGFGLDHDRALAGAKLIGQQTADSIAGDPAVRQTVLDSIAQASRPGAPSGPGRGVWIRPVERGH